MNLHLCTDRKEWDAVAQHVASEQQSFLHSWEWGAMQQAFGRTIYRYIAREGQEVCAALLCIVMPLPFGKSYFFSPYGPAVVLPKGSAAAAKANNTDLRTLAIALAHTPEAAQEKAIFWRCEPLGVIPAGFGVRVHDVEPSTTRVLDLRQGTDVLLAGMKQKTRYNIRLAEKKGVTVAWHAGGDKPDWAGLADQWWTLVSETSQRHAIHSHSRDYYELMMRTLGNAGMCQVGVASHDGETLAMQLCIRFGDTNTYVHGASTNHKKEFMAPYALQWSAIERSVQAGCKWYDFYGVSPEGADESHYLASVSRFKAGFGGSIRQYSGTIEVPFSQRWFTVYRLVKRLRS